MKWWGLGWVLFVAVACEQEDGQAPTVEDDPLPDITGEYSVDPILDVHGCAGRESEVSWLQGALEITGEPSALAFEFGVGFVLEGSVDSAFTFHADGTVDVSQGEQDLVIDGLVFRGDSGWSMDGDVVIDLVDSTNDQITCTLSARLEAGQNP